METKEFFYTDWSEEYINEWQTNVDMFIEKMTQLNVLRVTLTNKVTGCFLDNVKEDLQYGWHNKCINTIMPIIDVEVDINAQSLTLMQLKSLNSMLYFYAQEHHFEVCNQEDILGAKKVSENIFYIEIEPTPTPNGLLEIMEKITTLDKLLK